MSLLDLPNEILYMVGDHLEEPSDMNALCLANKDLYTMFALLLYKIDSAREGKALYWAAQNGREHTAKLALAIGANVNHQVPKFLEPEGVESQVHMSTSMDTPLHAAAKNGQTSMVKLLLDHGAQPNLQNAFSLTPLHECDFYSAETVQLLIENGCKLSPDEENGFSHRTLLHAINRQAGRETLQFLCYGGATEDIDEGLLILQATHSRNLTALKFFHERAVNIEVPPRRFRNPPLAIAVEMGSFEIVSWMLRVGVQVTEEVQARIRECVSLSMRPLSYPVWKLLVKKGMDLDALCPRLDRTLLMGTKNSLMDAKKLLKLGADPNVTSRDGKTALHYMVIRRNTKHVELLLDNGANVNITDVDGRNALHLACVEGSMEIVKLLVDHGVDMRTSDKNGLTPLHLACGRSNADVRKLLIDRGANQAIICKDGLTADEMGQMIDEVESALVSSNGDQISV